MITFSPIHPNIQETLIKKSHMLNKNSVLYSIGSPLTSKGGETLSWEEKTSGENYMFARSPFLRMTSLLTRNRKPVIIMGGEMDSIGNFRSGYDSIYGERTSLDSEGKKQVDYKNPMKRPIAGIKDISVEYKGGGMKLGATRTTNVNWTCWTWDELQRFKPYFLKHGRTVLIEFGWSFKGHDSPTLLDIITENGEIKLNEEDEMENITEILPEHILKQKGHYDAVIGVIQNFEFTVNETGGFDCTTDIVSMGVTTLQQMDSKENMMGHVHNLPVNEPLKGFWWWQGDDYLANIEDKNPYYNFIAYMKSLQGHLHKNAENSKGAIAYLDGDVSPFCTWGWFEDNVISRFIGIINEKNKVVTEFRSIENIYGTNGTKISSQPVKIRNSRDLLTPDYKKFFFLKNPNGTLMEGFKEDSLNTAFDLKLQYGPSLLGHYIQKWIDAFGPIPKEGEGKSFRVFPAPTDISFALQKAPPPPAGFSGELEVIVIDPGGERIEIPTLLDDDTREKLLKEIKDMAGPTYNIVSEQGYLRNVYFHHSFLEEAFEKAGTIKEGIMSVWNTFSSEFGGIYDFIIDYDDKEGRLLIRDKGFSEKRVETVLENKSTDDDYNLGNPGVYVFPVWEKNSMVKSQNLTSKIPSRMQVAAMYGANNAEKFGDGNIENYDDWGGAALGKAEKDSEKRDPFDTASEQEALYDSLVGNMEHPFKQSPERDITTGEPVFRYTFGNASADHISPLRWSSDGGNNTTGIYEDITNESQFKQDNSMFLGINEVLNEQLTGEYQRRLKAELGETDETPDKDKLDKDSIAGYKATWDNKEFVNKESELYVASGQMTGYLDVNTYGQLTIPYMKTEYKGIMKMALKGAKDGLLKQSDPVIPIELELDIDGTGGIFPGNSFHSSYLPESYMDRICFQVKGASHKVDSSGWTTTIQGQMRVAGYSAPTGSELRPTLTGHVQPEVIAPSTTATIGGESSGIAEQIPLGNLTNPDGSQATVPIYTTTNESLAQKLPPGAELLGSSEKIVGGNSEAMKEQQAKLAARIADVDDYWEVEHLTSVAAELDMAFLKGGKDPTLATGSGFLNWFLEPYKTGGSQPKGQDWAGKDSKYIQKALEEYKTKVYFSVPLDPQTLDLSALQGGN